MKRRWESSESDSSRLDAAYHARADESGVSELASLGRSYSRGDMTPLEVDVCLVISTQSATLAQLVIRIGFDGAEGSHDQGAPHVVKSRGKWKSTVWQLCSTRPRTAAIEEHLEELVVRLPPARVGSGVLPADARKHISIGVFSNAQIPVATLSERALAIGVQYGASMELRWYSPNEDK